MLLPDEEDAAQFYGSLPASERRLGFWSRVWPSAFALCEYLYDNKQLVAGKTVWELAAGLGLPSFLSSFYAEKVICTDNNSNAVQSIVKSIELNKVSNMTAAQWDFSIDKFPPESDIMLLSDANYDTGQNPALQQLLLAQLHSGKTIVVSTPLRLSGQGFFTPLMPYSKDNGSLLRPVDKKGNGVDVWVFCFEGVAQGSFNKSN